MNPNSGQTPISPKSINAGVYIGSKDAFGLLLEQESVLRALRRIDGANAMAVVAKVSWLLEEQGDLNEGLQLDFVNQLLSQLPFNRLKRVKELVVKYGRIVFFRHQVQILMKLITRYCTFGLVPQPIRESQLNVLGQSLLLVSDKIGVEVDKKRRHYSGDNPLEDLAIELFGTSFLVRRPWIIQGLVRSRTLFVDLHESFDTSHPDYLDMNSEFRSATGLNLSDYFSLGLAVMTYYLGFWGDSSKRGNSEYILFNPTLWFRDTSLPPDTIRQFLSLVTLAPPALRDDVLHQTNRELAYDFLILKYRPLLQLTSELFVPASFLYLYEKVTTGPYWILFDHLASHFREGDKLRLSRYVGRLFQAYVWDVLQEIDKRRADETLVGDQVYRVAKQELRTPDAMILGDHSLVLIEASATRVQAKRTTALGIPDAFKSDCQKMIFDNARSLDIFIRNLESGAASLDEFDPKTIARYYPVIVLIEGFPIYPVINDYIRGEIAALGYFENPRVAPVSILDIEEVEAIAGYSELSLLEALRGWHASPEFPRNSLGSHLASLLISTPNSWFDERINSTFGASSKLILGRTLSEIVTPPGIVDQLRSSDSSWRTAQSTKPSGT